MKHFYFTKNEISIESFEYFNQKSVNLDAFPVQNSLIS